MTRRAFCSLLASAIGALAVQFSVPNAREISWQKVEALFFTGMVMKRDWWKIEPATKYEPERLIFGWGNKECFDYGVCSCPLEDVLE